MAEIPVEFLINKLSSLLVKEVKLLKGVGDDLAEIQRELESLRAFLKDADSRQDGDHGLKEWVRQAREVALEIEDVLDEFMVGFGRQLKKGGFLSEVGKKFYSIMLLKARHNLGKKLKQIHTRVSNISERKERYNLEPRGTLSLADSKSSQLVSEEAHFAEQTDIVGIHRDVEKITRWLVDGDSRLTLISMVGMGGSGKTTLARKVYNSSVVKGRFHCQAWASISQSFNARNLFLSLIRSFYKSGGEVAPEAIFGMDTMSLAETLYMYLRNKRYFLLLDNINNTEALNLIKVALPKNCFGNRIATTTRVAEIVAQMANEIDALSLTHDIQPLPQETSIALFCKKAFPADPERPCPLHLKKVCEELVSKCGGLPLAIVTLGGAMRDKGELEDEWRNVLRSLCWAPGNHLPLQNLRAVLYRSYEELPPHLKSCFLYCCAFPENYLFNCYKLIRLWMAEGFIKQRDGASLEEVGKDYLYELISKCMLQMVEGSFGRSGWCRMHDLMHDLSVNISRENDFCFILKKGSDIRSRNIRRLSLHNIDNGDTPLCTPRTSHLRTLAVYGIQKLPLKISTILAYQKLLRVLVLDGIQAAQQMPKSLGDLFHLRYLSLKNTRFKKLPESIGKLQNLQTLDLGASEIDRLPKEISKIRCLRFISCSSSTIGEHPIASNRITGCRIPAGIHALVNLQELLGVVATTEIVEEVGNLVDLKAFAIIKVKAEHGSKICSSIEKMAALRLLRIFCFADEEPLQLQTLTIPPQNLQILSLAGVLERLPHWFTSLNNLTELALLFSGLKEDPFPFLQVLPNLQRLSLCRAYNGKELRCQEGAFPILKELRILEFAELQIVEIEESALLKLEILDLSHCEQMKRVPHGIQYLTSLQLLSLRSVAKELIESIGPKGEDRHNVQHIPKILHSYGDGVRFDGLRWYTTWQG